MLKSFYTAVLYAIDNIRTNFFHTLLSVIGITIGVSALIIILSMIDGLQAYAEDQISSTTSVKVVEVSSVTMQSVDGVSIPKEDTVLLTDQIHEDLLSAIEVPYSTYRVSEVAKQVSVEEQQIGALIYYADSGYADYYPLAHGTPLFDGSDSNGNGQTAVISTALAERIRGELFEPDNVIGKNLDIDNVTYNIIGIVEGLS